MNHGTWTTSSASHLYIQHNFSEKWTIPEDRVARILSEAYERLPLWRKVRLWFRFRRLVAKRDGVNE
jgi:hypothetical protein